MMVDPLDLDGMAKAIANLMGSPERRAAFAEKGIERAAPFRWEQTARQTLAIYRAAIEGHPAVEK
jgi:alpha-1,3-rhamnosyl/mannosyltransferase